MARKSPNADQEQITDANLAKVIKMLEKTEDNPKPWTKKECCEFLGMNYNTTRLAKLIEVYQEKVAREKQRRSEKRGKPATQDEKRFVVQTYLEGGTIDGIAKSLYRSAPFVKQILEEEHVPIRARAHDYFKPVLIPEGAMRERFAPGELVYSAQYDSLAKIDAELPKRHDLFGYVYRVWLLSDKWQQYAHIPACEVASLAHLREKGLLV